MKEIFKAAYAASTSNASRQYEYLVLTVMAGESMPLAYQRLREHAEYGKWELERSRLYMGGGRQYWLRRRVLRVERTF